MIYEIINPSDPYTIECESFLIAALSCVLLGEGRYAFEPDDESESVPIFLFGGSEEWFENKFNSTLSELFESNKLKVSEALSSVLIGNKEDRKSYFTALELIEGDEKKERYRQQYLDDRRSSMNNIGERAIQLSKILKEKVENNE